MVCQNKWQIKKPGPPNYWFHRRIQCVDYKIRHQCECLYGCLKQKEEHIKKDIVKVILPKTETLFDECYWQPFVDTSTPNKGYFN